MLSHNDLWVYLVCLDCPQLPKELILQTHSGWDTVYDWTIDQINFLGKKEVLPVGKATRIIRNMQEHAVARHLSVY